MESNVPVLANCSHIGWQGKHMRIVSWDMNPKRPCFKCGEHSQDATSTVPVNTQITAHGSAGSDDGLPHVLPGVHSRMILGED